MKEQFLSPRNFPALLLGVLSLSGFYLASLYSYLLFHSLAELFSIVIACSIFALSWNSRRFMEQKFFVFIGIAYLFIGVLDLVHTLAYKGMGVFPEYGANLPTQLWIAARYVNSLSLLVATLLIGRRIHYPAVFFLYFLTVFLLLGAIFSWGIFPDCYVEGAGLTPFKIASEYIISLILLGTVFLLLHRRREFESRVLTFLVSSILLAIGSELAFTFYIGVYDLSNLIGHYFKLISFYFIYKAIIETGLLRPYDLLFRELKQREEELQRAHDGLELRVRQRTAELTQANEALQTKIAEHRQAEKSLRESEKKYSRLVENSLTGIFIVQDDKIAFANQRFADIHGYRLDELIGMEIRNLFHPDDRAWTDEIRAKRLRGEPVPSEYESRGLTKDGRPIWITRRNTVIEYGGRPAILGNIVEVTERKKMEEVLQESEKGLRVLSAQLLKAQESERKWIAQELHDSIGQILVATKFSLERKLSQMKPAEAPSGISLEDILSMVQNGIDETRRIMTNLRPSLLDDLGILATLKWFCREFQKVHPQVQIQKEMEIQEEEIPGHLKVVLFRVLQEAMNNFAKHANGDRVFLSLGKKDGALEFAIRDNGRGFDLETSRKGLGLNSMKERVEFSGGTFAIESTPGKGTRVRGIWPL